MSPAYALAKKPCEDYTFISTDIANMLSRLGLLDCKPYDLYAWQEEQEAAAGRQADKRLKYCKSHPTECTLREVCGRDPFDHKCSGLATPLGAEPRSCEGSPAEQGRYRRCAEAWEAAARSVR